MAGGQHTSTRRQVLGAAVVLPVLSAVEGPLVGSVGAEGPLHRASHGPPPRPGEDLVAGEWQSFAVTVWDRAVAAYLAAAGEVARIEATTRGATFEEESEREEAYGVAGDAMYDALRGLLRSPAPDLAALACKIELIVEHDVGTLTGGEACIAALLGDVRRLASDVRARTGGA
jgi:hypothetical protein